MDCLENDTKRGIMQNNFMPPRPGEQVPLICLKCHKNFCGPNPGVTNCLLDRLFSRTKKAKCPECGSSKIVRNPYIHF